MDNITIIGGGFSAFLAKVLIRKPTRVVNLSHQSFTHVSDFIRRPSLDVNKFLLPKARSFGSLFFCLKQTYLHDRLYNGGNSAIWGGIVDIRDFSKRLIRNLLDNGIQIKLLSFSITGTISNRKSLAQLLDKSGRIFDVASHLRSDENFFLDSFSIDGQKIALKLISLSNLKQTKVIYTDKLVLCVGVIQTLDLLYRSGFLVTHDKISLSEYGHSTSFKFTLSSNSFAKGGSTIVRFDLLRAISHFLGIQKRLFLSYAFQWVPFYIDQTFFVANTRREFVLEDAVVSEVIQDKKKENIFGKSIHYCDMEINHKGINEFLREISPNLIGLGMAFVSQKNPGPISNDIILDAEKKTSRINNY